MEAGPAIAASSSLVMGCAAGTAGGAHSRAGGDALAGRQGRRARRRLHRQMHSSSMPQPQPTAAAAAHRHAGSAASRSAAAAVQQRPRRQPRRHRPPAAAAGAHPLEGRLLGAQDVGQDAVEGAHHHMDRGHKPGVGEVVEDHLVLRQLEGQGGGCRGSQRGQLGRRPAGTAACATRRGACRHGRQQLAGKGQHMAGAEGWTRPCCRLPACCSSRAAAGMPELHQARRWRGHEAPHHRCHGRHLLLRRSLARCPWLRRQRRTRHARTPPRPAAQHPAAAQQPAAAAARASSQHPPAG